MKVQALNDAGYSSMSPESALVSTGNVAEASMSLRLMYHGDVVLSNNASIQALNRTFRYEWCNHLKIPTNRFHVSKISQGFFIRLLKKTHFVRMNFTLLTTGTDTKATMESVVATIKSQIETRGSTVHNQGLSNNVLDFGYMFLDWVGDPFSKEYIWELAVAPKPTNKLNTAGALALGILCFVLIPYGINMWMPFYYAKKEEGLTTGDIIHLTLVIWLGVLKVYWGKIKKWCKIWSETECGKKTLGLCRKNRKILPEDIDPMTGMPYGFDPKYFPDGMPPDAMKRYEENMRAERSKATKDKKGKK